MCHTLHFLFTPPPPSSIQHFMSQYLQTTSSNFILLLANAKYFSTATCDSIQVSRRIIVNCD